jgi:threonine dehydrogenase-like Zn-dependent dehydrogenase
VKAVVLRRPQVLEVADVPKPRLTDPVHVLIRVEACGICGSDLRYWAGENPWALHTLGRHVPNPPNIILGHEYAGVVVEVNSSAYEHLLGKRVGVQSYRTCGECGFCRSGRQNLCRRTIHMGHAQGWGEMDLYPGAYAEYCLGWGDLLYPLPDSLPFDEAAMADVLCVGVHVVGRAARPDGDALCIGGGPVGLSIAQVAKAGGALRVFISEPSECARRVLEQYPEFILIDPAREGLAGSIARVRGEAGVAAVYDSIGAAETMMEAIPLLEESGTYVNVAVHDVPVTINAAALGSERTITSSSNAHYSDVQKAYEYLFSGEVKVGPMLTHRFALENAQAAFDLLLATPKQAFKAVLLPH